MCKWSQEERKHSGGGKVWNKWSEKVSKRVIIREKDQQTDQLIRQPNPVGS